MPALFTLTSEATAEYREAGMELSVKPEAAAMAEEAAAAA